MSQNSWTSGFGSKLPGLGFTNAVKASILSDVQGGVSSVASSSTQKEPASKPEILPHSNVDMSALEGVTPQQLSAIFRLFQAGAAGFPDGLAAPIGAPNPRTKEIGNDLPQNANTIDPPSDVNGSDSDEHEEGEIDELEMQQVEKPDAIDPPAPREAQRDISVKEARAKAFLIELHHRGLGFEKVSQYVDNVELLRSVYEDLRLPHTHHRHTAQSSAKTSPAEELDNSLTSSSTKEIAKRTPSEPANIVSAVKGPVDRNEYLAKLAAAKAKKTAPAKKNASDTQTLPAPVHLTEPTKPHEAPKVTPLPVKSTIKTDLIRQRLEALRKSQAEKAAVGSPLTGTSISQEKRSGAFKTSPRTQSSSENSTEGISDPNKLDVTHNPPVGPDKPQPDMNIANSTTTFPIASAVHEPNQHIPASRFPGLFMTPSIAPPSNVETSNIQMISSAQGPSSQPKRSASPVAEELSSPPKRPFGQSRPNSDDEQLIITVSDDEDDGMDIDDVSGEEGNTPYSLSERSISNESSPLMVTEYERKLLEIADFRRRIAEREKKVKSNNDRLAQVANSVELQSTAGSGPPSPPKAEPSTPQATSTSLMESAHIEAPIEAAAIPKPSSPGPRHSPEATTHPAVEVIQSAEIRPVETSGQNFDTHLQSPPDTSSVPAIASPETSNAENPRTHLDLEDVETADPDQSTALPVEPSSDEMDLESDDGNSDKMDLESDNDKSESDIDSSRLDMTEKNDQFYPGNDDDDLDDTSDDDTDDESDAESDDDSGSSDEGLVSSDGGHHSAHDGVEEDLVVQDTPTHTHLKPSGSRDLSPTNLSLDTHPNVVTGSNSLSEATPSLSQMFEKPLPKTYFTAYESPLLKFKDYRYHPDFPNTVPPGLSKLTSSHGLDVNDVLCPYEAAGGRCNDKNCIHQHFENMGLPGPELLNHPSVTRAPTDDPEATMQ